MRKNIVKRAGLAFFALVFGALPMAKAGAVENNYTSKGKTYCDAGAASVFVAICSNSTPTLLGSEPTTASGLVTITMHVKAGEGHFEGEADPLTHSKEFYFRDPFDDYTEPVSERSDYVFAGWSRSEAATTVDFSPTDVRAGQVGSDIYAVWSNKAYVYYHTPNGIWREPGTGDEYQHVLMEYTPGTAFQYLNPDPQPLESRNYDFVGWYERMNGQGLHYTNETIIDTLITDVYSAWNYNAEGIDNEMLLNEKYDVTVGVSVPVFTFTAPETATYEIYTEGIVSEGEDAFQGMVRVQDIFDRNLAMESQIDPSTGWGDVHTFYEMRAGETYYIRFGEAQGNFLRFKASIRKATMVNITFDADKDGTMGAYFGTDPAQTSKVMAFPVGYDIRTEMMEDLNYDDENVSFGVWNTLDDDGHSYLLVTEDLTYVYAWYVEMVTVHLDYNGGYDPFDKDEHSMDAKFIPGSHFETPIDPDIDDPAIDFVGWSRDPHATKPDEDIIEANTSADTLKNETLYAVWGEKVPVTFVVGGGAFMLDDPNITVFEDARAKGHVFYGMSVMHFDSRVRHLGWTDQDGEFIWPWDVVGDYHIKGETTFTAVLGFRLTAFANGGLFPYGGIAGAEIIGVEVPYEDEDSVFYIDDILDRTGIPVNQEDENKRFLGFATTPDATEPDIIDGETRLVYLDHIFAVWGDPKEDEDEEVPPVPDTGANTKQIEMITSSSIVLFATVIVMIPFGVFAVRKSKE